MARIRSIKPDFWKSEKLATRLPGPDGREARRLFVGLWNFAEDHGVIRGAIGYIRSEIYPYDDDVTAADVERWLAMLDRADFIVRFQRDGSRYIWIRGFKDHQKIDRPGKPSLPNPSESEQAPRQFDEPSTNARRALDEPSTTDMEVGSRSGGGSGGEVEVELFAGAKTSPAEPQGPTTDHLRAQGALVLNVNAKPDRRKRKPEPATDPRHRPLVLAMTERFGLVTGAEYGFHGQDAKAVSELLTLARGDSQEVLRRWEASLRAVGWGHCDAIHELPRHWNKHRPGAPPGPQQAEPEKKCRVI